MRPVGLGLCALLLVGATYVYLGYGSKPVDPARVARDDVKKLEKAVQAYCIRTGDYPASLDALVGTGTVAPDGLKDPWKHEYQYDPTGRKNKGNRPDIWTVTPARE